jgi:hypothetical protein
MLLVTDGDKTYVIGAAMAADGAVRIAGAASAIAAIDNLRILVSSVARIQSFVRVHEHADKRVNPSVDFMTATPPGNAASVTGISQITSRHIASYLDERRR